MTQLLIVAVAVILASALTLLGLFVVAVLLVSAADKALEVPEPDDDELEEATDVC
jgi:hypothetical protein